MKSHLPDVLHSYFNGSVKEIKGLRCSICLLSDHATSLLGSENVKSINPNPTTPSPPPTPSNLGWVLIPRILNRLLEIPKQALNRTILVPIGNNLISDPVSRFGLHLLTPQDLVCREIALALEMRLDPVA